MVGVTVRDMAALGVRRDHDRRDTGAVAEEVERLDVAGVPVSAAFVEGDQDRGVCPQLGLACTWLMILLRERLEQVELGRGRVAIEQSRPA